MRYLVLCGFLLLLVSGVYVLYVPAVDHTCLIHADLDTLEKKLEEHVWMLAETIGERHFQNPGSLDRSATYIHDRFLQAGLQPRFHEYDEGTYRNVIADINSGSHAGRMILIGAHYDSVWMSPGADDNASGVAVLLELAGLLSGIEPGTTLRFVAFTNEEQPFAGSGTMGSMVYLQQYHPHADDIKAMYSLEMLGFYSDEPGSQVYPPPLKWIYPDTASFIAMVANLPSGRLLQRSLAAFRQQDNFPAQGLVMSEKLVPDIRRSDHAGFWDAGIPAIMITDTAFYRNNRYHTVGDLPHTLEYRSMAKLTSGLACMLDALASE